VADAGAECSLSKPNDAPGAHKVSGEGDRYLVSLEQAMNQTINDNKTDPATKRWFDLRNDPTRNVDPAASGALRGVSAGLRHKYLGAYDVAMASLSDPANAAYAQAK